jgi:branched-subunit amino acid transport protein
MKIKSLVVVSGKAFLFSILHTIARLIFFMLALAQNLPKNWNKILTHRGFGIVLTKASHNKGVIYHARRVMDKMLDNLRGLP